MTVKVAPLATVVGNVNAPSAVIGRVVAAVVLQGEAGAGEAADRAADVVTVRHAGDDNGVRVLSDAGDRAAT